MTEPLTIASPTGRAALELARELREAGFTAYLAGGCVRDILLGQQPKDFDIATDAPPEKVQQLFPKSHAVGAHFGVVIVKRHGTPFEVATFRQDGTYEDGRRPSSVVFTSPEEDAKRRDFTVNGLFFDPVRGRVIDFVGGRADLESGLLRAIGDPGQRFAEDHLRLLRAVRLATTLGFAIEDQTWRSLKEHAGSIGAIAPERVRDELVKTLVHPNRVRGFDLLVESGLMAAVLPEVMELRGCEQPPQWHPEGDVFTHTRIMLGLLGDDASPPLVLSVLFHDIGKPPTFSYDEAEGRIRFNGHDRVGARMTEMILRRLRFSNETVAATVEAVANHMVFKDVQRMRTAKLKRFMARPSFADELELHRVDCTSSHGMLDNVAFLREKEDEFASEPLIPPPLVTGHDLIGRGHRPGPDFGEILTDIQNLQLEGKLASRDEALAYLDQTYPAPAR